MIKKIKNIVEEYLIGTKARNLTVNLCNELLNCSRAEIAKGLDIPYNQVYYALKCPKHSEIWQYYHGICLRKSIKKLILDCCNENETWFIQDNKIDFVENIAVFKITTYQGSSNEKMHVHFQLAPGEIKDFINNLPGLKEYIKEENL